jgi:hypothetical protein
MLVRTGDPAGPSKSELKKRAKQLEKEKKAAEKAAKQQEIASQQAAAEVVRFEPVHPSRSQSHSHDVSIGLRNQILRPTAFKPIAITPPSTPRSYLLSVIPRWRNHPPTCPPSDIPCPRQQDGLPQPPPAHRLCAGTPNSDTREGFEADGQMGCKSGR